MKVIKVSAAIIYDEKTNMVLATEKWGGLYNDKWEFPGGKIEAGEFSSHAVIREIKEELDIDISVISLLTTIEYTYPEFQLIMDCYLCKIEAGCIKLNEAKACRWLTKDDLCSLDWLPADKLILPYIEQIL